MVIKDSFDLNSFELLLLICSYFAPYLLLICSLFAPYLLLIWSKTDINRLKQTKKEAQKTIEKQGFSAINENQENENVRIRNQQVVCSSHITSSMFMRQKRCRQLLAPIFGAKIVFSQKNSIFLMQKVRYSEIELC